VNVCKYSAKVKIKQSTLKKYRSVTDTQTNRHTHNDGIYHASIALHGKNQGAFYN